MSPVGNDLDLSMGWDRFEQLVLALFKRVQGARDVKFRRYGTQGQAQHGIDLAGRDADGSYVVVQCKEYSRLTAADLRAAVETLAEGPRPFAARAFVVVTSASTQSTQLAEELAALQDEHSDLEIDLWGGEVLNDQLRGFADIVARFWTRETASVFCTGVPVPGVPAPPPDRQEQAERILLGPLNTSDVKPTLRAAEAARADDPRKASELFGQVAERLAAAGFHGHSFVLRRRQLDVMDAETMADEAIALASELAVAAVMRGERDEARALDRLVTKLDGDADTHVGDAASRHRHRELLDALVGDTMRTVGSPTGLLAALRATADIEDQAYHPPLVLYLAEDLFATEPASLAEVQDLVEAAIERAQEEDDATSDVLLRLRLVKAEYDEDERRSLLRSARRHLVTGRAAAMINAREARRCALEGRVEEASEAWRDAVQDAIHAGLNDDAADWLYAIRELNIKYGPWTTALDDEHRLAQAVRATSSGRILDRSRDPREAAMSALVRGKPIEALLSARRWLLDSCITGSWAHEGDAAQVLGDIYADNREPALAATLYQRVGAWKKVTELAGRVGDLLLPTTPWSDKPWWMVHAQAVQLSAQEDLLDDKTATRLLEGLLDLARRGRAGELMDSPTGALTLQAAKTACDLAPRGNPQQAQEVLDLLADDVAREKNRIFHTDDEHSTACVGIALAHPALAGTALTRLIDLASYDAQPAQKALARGEVLALLSGRDEDGILPPSLRDCLSSEERESLRDRIVGLVEDGRYLADVVLESIDPGHALVQEHARAARDSILARPDPVPSRTEFGTEMVRQAYLASLLSTSEARDCLDKLMVVASDAREAASNRQDALKGARHLVLSQPPDVRAAVFEQSRSFAVGDRDGSALDDLTREPHPLSTAQISIGSASLRGDGLSLAHAAADCSEQQEWVRDQAVGLLRSAVQRDIHAAAVVINGLPFATIPVDADLLAASQHTVVRQVAGLLAVREPERYQAVLTRLASDADHRVRRTLAEGIARSKDAALGPLASARSTLEQDPRHSVRVSLGNRPEWSSAGT
ncbi:restriction endonuclease [Kribbella orskensis]|uniref:Restriction endonuclease n=1 Tax=Kribbella orskensis TaxID=2512216 RepID=A0ABY2B9F9_9ACTN|nr:MULTISPECIES: restriction endonuclease [Kribbella]TCN32162.1 restriction endonuclease [Kribbella sp. VKM Ac-2500]TCO12181.1 restriction endonuclease [Kribbella orskensis]